MYSTFIISTSECTACINEALKSLGSLLGVFGAEIDPIGGKIGVSHTEEVSREKIAERLLLLGYSEIENKEEQTLHYDEPSTWGCAL